MCLDGLEMPVVWSKQKKCVAKYISYFLDEVGWRALEDEISSPDFYPISLLDSNILNRDITSSRLWWSNPALLLIIIYSFILGFLLGDVGVFLKGCSKLQLQKKRVTYTQSLPSIQIINPCYLVWQLLILFGQSRPLADGLVHANPLPYMFLVSHHLIFFWSSFSGKNLY